MAHLSPQWTTVDEWWDQFVRDQKRGVIELRELVETLNQRWEQSNASFDVDPLIADWTESNPQAGPLRTNQEENWSQWLAHLIRDSSGKYPTEMFDLPFDTVPTRVRCERAYHDEDLHDRRVDILAEFESQSVTIEAQGVTIEVKIGDEHYQKTPQTAYLTEKHHQQNLNWTHYLLVPRYKRDVIQQVFGDQLSDPESHRPTITATGSNACNITVIYWEDVAQTLRRTLLSATEQSAHWNASAYLFTTLIEEQILRFYALSSLDEYRYESPGISEVERIQAVDPDEQIEYLERLLEVIAHE